MNPSSPHNRKETELDTRLAQFADLVINGKVVQRSADGHLLPGEGHKTENCMDEASMAELEETILRLNAAVKAARPDSASSARIAAGVMAARRKPAPLRSGGWLQNLRRGSGLQAAAAFAVLTLLLAAGLLLQSGEGSLTGAAVDLPFSGTSMQWWPPLLIIVGFILVFVLLKKDRS
jgi:hypothetical protein